VISRRCLTLEDDLIRLKGRLAESEASQKNLNQAIFELGKEKKDAFEELERIKVDLATKDGDVKAVVDARDEAVKEMKHLMG
jgi:predicted  nucleic acid-binding Zn-ribbon protein